MKDPAIVGPGEGDVLEAGENRITLKVTSKHSERMSVLEYRVGPRFRAPPVLHHHTREDWVAYVTEGQVTFVFSDREVNARRGATVFVPAGVDFAWRNDTDEPAVYVAIHAPSGFDQFFIDVVEEVEAHGGSPTPEVMREVIPPLWTKYGIEGATR